MVSLSNRKGNKARITINMIAVPTILLAGESSTLSGQVQKNGRPAAGIVTSASIGIVVGARNAAKNKLQMRRICRSC